MMNLKTVSNAITSRAGRQILIAQKHSPHILFGAGVVGVVATAVMASRATLKLDDVLEDTNKKVHQAQEARKLAAIDDGIAYSETDYKQDMVIVRARAAMAIVKLYTPTVIVGVTAIACLTGSHVILNRRNIGLTAAYATLEKGFNEYRQRVRDEFGVEKDQEFRFGVAEREIVEEGENGPEVKIVKHAKDPSIYARFFDECNPNWTRNPETNLVFLQAQQNYANQRLQVRGHVLLNDIYDSLGMERSSAGAVVGWVINDADGPGDNHIDFGIFDESNSRARDFVNGREASILLDFNVDGVIYDKIDHKRRR